MKGNSDVKGKSDRDVKGKSDSDVKGKSDLPSLNTSSQIIVTTIIDRLRH